MLHTHLSEHNINRMPWVGEHQRGLTCAYRWPRTTPGRRIVTPVSNQDGKSSFQPASFLLDLLTALHSCKSSHIVESAARGEALQRTAFLSIVQVEYHVLLLMFHYSLTWKVPLVVYNVRKALQELLQLGKQVPCHQRPRNVEVSPADPCWSAQLCCCSRHLPKLAKPLTFLVGTTRQPVCPKVSSSSGTRFA